MVAQSANVQVYRCLGPPVTGETIPGRLSHGPAPQNAARSIPLLVSWSARLTILDLLGKVVNNLNRFQRAVPIRAGARSSRSWRVSLPQSRKRLREVFDDIESWLGHGVVVIVIIEERKNVTTQRLYEACGPWGIDRVDLVVEVSAVGSGNKGGV